MPTELSPSLGSEAKTKITAAGLLSQLAAPLAAPQAAIALALHHGIENLSPAETVALTLASAVLASAIGIHLDAQTLIKTGQCNNPVTMAIYEKTHRAYRAAIGGSLYGWAFGQVTNPANLAALWSGDATYVACSVIAGCNTGLAFSVGTNLLIRAGAVEPFTRPIRKVFEKVEQLKDKCGVTDALNQIKTHVSFKNLAQDLKADVAQLTNITSVPYLNLNQF